MFRCILLVLLVFSRAAALSGGTASLETIGADRVEANCFVMKDARGRNRVIISMDSEDVARIRVLDERGMEAASISSFPDGTTGVCCRDQGGAIRAALGATWNGIGYVSVFDKDSQARLELRVDARASASVVFKDGDGKIRTRIE